MINKDGDLDRYDKTRRKKDGDKVNVVDVFKSKHYAMIILW